LMQRLPPRSYVEGRAFELKKGQPLAIEPFRQRLAEAGYASVSQVVSPGEFAVRGSLLDVFPMGSATPLRIDLFDDEIEAIRRHDIERPVLSPAELFLPPAELEAALGAFASITLDAFKAETELSGGGAEVRNFPTTAPRELRIDVRAEQPFAPLDTFLKGFAGRVLLAADSAGRREVLHEMLRAHGHEVTVLSGWDAFARGEARLALTVAPALKGLQLTTPAIAVVAEAQLFGARARQERRRKRAAADPEAILRDLKDINPGAPVVHEEYGVGRYAGLIRLDIGGQPGGFLVLEYLE